MKIILNGKANSYSTLHVPVEQLSWTEQTDSKNLYSPLYKNLFWMGKTSRFKVLCSSRGFKLVSFFVNGICKDSFTLGSMVSIRSFLILVPHLFSGLSGIIPGYIGWRSWPCSLAGFCTQILAKWCFKINL